MGKSKKIKINLKMNIYLISVCYLAIGIMLLLFPSVSLVMICNVMGILCMIGGIVRTAWYFIRKGYLDSMDYGFFMGTAALLLGLYAVLRTENSAFAFAQMLGLCMVLDSILKLQYSMDLLRMKNERWWWVLAAAAVMLGLSMTILINPFKDANFRSIYTYSVLIADGVVNIVTGLYVSHELKRFTDRKEMHEVAVVPNAAEQEMKEDPDTMQNVSGNGDVHEEGDA